MERAVTTICHRGPITYQQMPAGDVRPGQLIVRVWTEPRGAGTLGVVWVHEVLAPLEKLAWGKGWRVKARRTPFVSSSKPEPGSLPIATGTYRDERWTQ